VSNKHEIQFKKEPAKWTVLIYFAADNDLDDEALANLKMMKKVGSTNEVNIVAQIDSRGKGSTFRFLIQDEQSSLDEDIVGDPLPEINTGDPRELSDFINWGLKEYPAQNTMLVLWGHGRGWENQDNAGRAAPLTTDIIQYRDYKGDELQGWSIARTNNRELRRFLRASSSESSNPEQMLQARGSWQYAGRYPGRYLTAGQFKDSDNEAVAGFLLDQTAKEALESSQDVLRLDELSSALENALGGKTKNKIDILGMDACLMGMIEVGYQVRESVNYLVATEDTIPDDGWPYDRILARLVECPDLSPEDFSATIVREYLIHYRELERDVTKSALNLNQSRILVGALKEFASDLTKRLSEDNVRVAVLGARAVAQNFYIKDYVDLYDFCYKLEKLCLDEGVKSGCKMVMDAIHRSEPKDTEGRTASSGNGSSNDFVSEYGFIGHRMRGSNGISIYFPIVEPSTKYAELPFAKDSEWYGFLNKLARQFPEIEHHSEDEGRGGAGESGVKAIGNGCDGLKTCTGTGEKFGQGMVQVVPPIRRRDCAASQSKENKTKTMRAKGSGRSKEVKK
jgi:cysteine peptidase C11 family protein